MESPMKLTSKFNSSSCLLMAIEILLKEAEKGSNFVFSPMSFNSMLSLIAVGATGSTLNNLLSFLGSESIGELNSLASQIAISVLSPENENHDLARGPIVSFVNGAWVDQRFALKPSFEKIVKDVYHATAEKVDFANKANQVVDEVNFWIGNATKGLIRNLIQPGILGSDTALVLANALYFKGAWDQKFDSSKTVSKNFHLLNGRTVKIPYMTERSCSKHYYGSFDDYKVLKMSYQNGQDTRRFSMYFFLPNARNGLQNLVDNFKANPMILNNPVQVQKRWLTHLWLPKFKFSFEFEALQAMHELGHEEQLFNNLGHLTEMVDSPQSPVISKLLHKSFIEVNEEGTEAAASSAAIFAMNCGGRLEFPSFVADHPFLFTIKEENSGIIFFVGAVLNPLLVT
ncbi:serpin-ZX [Ricinus communis]|uniref:serpin-ZX n=1 Tax=Ricinus communis TaxID=3988 RepID=UPI00201AC105|nr:serpin-ZX [Ricinus communis]